MTDKKAIITGIEAYLPEYILTNAELSTMVDTSDEWIMSRVGIKERRILKEDGLGTSFMGEQAVKKLLESRKEKTVQDAVNRVGISRSAFYKYCFL